MTSHRPTSSEGPTPAIASTPLPFQATVRATTAAGSTAAVPERAQSHGTAAVESLSTAGELTATRPTTCFAWRPEYVVCFHHPSCGGIEGDPHGGRSTPPGQPSHGPRHRSGGRGNACRGAERVCRQGTGVARRHFPGVAGDRAGGRNSRRDGSHRRRADVRVGKRYPDLHRRPDRCYRYL